MANRYTNLQPTEKQALNALSLLSGKWQPVVLLTLTKLDRPGFNDIETAIPDISGKALTDTLQALQDDNLVERTVINESPLRVEYELTPAGHELTEVFDLFAQWGGRHLDAITATVLVAGADRRVNEMYARWLSEHYTVRQADNGEQLMDAIDADLDMILFDHHLAGIDPKHVHQLSPPGCWTVLLTDERPPFEILAIDCDGVLCKPLVRSTVLDTVDQYLSRGQVTDRQLEGLIMKKQLFEQVYDPQTLAENERYTDFRERLVSVASQE